jgi:hypothetical protein
VVFNVSAGSTVKDPATGMEFDIKPDTFHNKHSGKCGDEVELSYVFLDSTKQKEYMPGGYEGAISMNETVFF